MFTPLFPIFAALGVDDLIKLVFGLVVFIGWILNLVANKNKAAQQANRPRPVRPRDGKLQKEIDQFLEESKPGQPKSKPQPSRPSAPPRKTPAPTAGQNRGKEKEKPKKQPAAQQESPSRRRPPGVEVADRPAPVSKDLGAGVRTHVAEHLQAGKIEHEVAEDLKNRVGESVTQHLGTFSAATRTATTSSVASPAAQHIAELLRNPASVRQAILINTLLSPPPGLRSRVGGNSQT